VDDQRRRITEDLAGMLKGELRCDPMAIAMFSSDASLYQVAPLGVVFPQDRDDVITLARYAEETNIPLIARGAGTGVTGAALGGGLIVDFSRNMRRIEWIDDQTVRVEPGIVYDVLNRKLRKLGRYFPPDPHNARVTTVGSMLAVDAAGSRSVRVGSARDHVESIEVVLAGGATVEFGTESLDILKTHPPSGTPTFLDSGSYDDSTAKLNVKRTIISKLVKLLEDNNELIVDRQPQLIRNCSGYYLRGILANNHLRLARMLVGSEGTLGLFTAATLHTTPLPEHRGIVLMLFGQLEEAIQAVQEIALQQPSACDLLDRRVLTLARESHPHFEKIISQAAEAALIVEQTGYSSKQARDRIQMVTHQVRTLNSQAVIAYEAYDFDEVEFLWSLPRTVVPLLARIAGPARPLPFVEDIAVPTEMLHDFLIRAQKVLQKHDVTASLYAHAAAGQVHLRPILMAPMPEDGPRIEAIARDLYQVVFSVAGTISGEHGDGLSRTAFIRSQYGPLYKVFQQIKNIFDPHNLLNPGKIISDDPHVTLRNFRPPTVQAPATVELNLRWNTQELNQTAALCNGCGDCRTQHTDSRMCPFFHISPAEDASPRAKANVMRNFACRTISPQDVAAPDMKRLIDLCFNCKQCQLECPENVNIPQLMIEAKAEYVQANGLNRADWILSRAHSFGVVGCTVAPVLNWAMNSPMARWLLEKLIGVHHQRKLPLLARRSFLRSSKRHSLMQASEIRKGRPIVYFVDHYANYHDPELGRAFVRILEHNDVDVHIPPGQTVSGMAMVSSGDLNAARKVAEQNVLELAELAREGLSIVCTEPAAALCLKYEYPMLLDHPDVDIVAKHVIESGTLLRQLHQSGRLRTNFQPLDMDAGYHLPCHLKALGIGTPSCDLLSLIPNLRVHRIEEGCSGMAGAYGLTKENYRTSIRIGWPLISRMRARDLDIGITECSSCKFQMEQGTTSPTLHPMKLLALSYGLMPEIREKLKPATKKLVVT